MNRNNFFKFEEDNMDFPFYNEKMDSNRNIIIMLISIILFILLAIAPVKFFNGQEQLMFFFVTLIPLLLFTKGNMGQFFRKLTINNIRLIIICYIGYKIYYLAVYFMFTQIGFVTTPPVNVDLSWMMIIINIFQVIGEEIFRIFIFLISMHLIFNQTKNRKKSIMLSVIIVLVIFGLLHYNTYPNIIQILLLQGFGSIFELFGYLKTKNLLVAILIHLLINLSSWIPLM